MAEDNDHEQTGPLQRKVTWEASGCLLCVAFTTLTLFCANRALWVGWLLAIPAVYFFRVWLEEVCPEAVRVIRAGLWALLGMAIVAVALQFVFGLLLGTEDRPARVHPDRANILKLVLSIEVYRDRRGCLPVADSEVEGERSNAFVVGLLRDTTTRDGPYLELEDAELKDGAFVDSCGNPFHIALDTNGDGWVQVGKDKVNKQIAIWSCGENGINEFGQGDDLRSW